MWWFLAGMFGGSALTIIVCEIIVAYWDRGRG